MTRFTNKGYDVCVVGNWDNTLVASATGAAAASVSATLANDATNLLYITGFQINSTNPAATVNGVVTVTGLVGGATLSYEFVESATFGGALQVQFANPIPANNVSTSIVVNCPAITSGGAVTVNVQGYKTQE